MDLLFDKENIVAVCKPAGLATIPESDVALPCLQGEVGRRLGVRLYAVHRLDKEASGVVLFARDAEAHRYLNGLFERREVEKYYVVVVHGMVAEDCGVIDARLREFGSGRVGVASDGKPARTDFRVLARSPGGYSLVLAHPATGRKHQLRAHFYSRGHALVGDLRYGDRAKQTVFPRLMLHAVELGFRLPSGRGARILAPVSDSWGSVLCELGFSDADRASAAADPLSVEAGYECE